MIRKIRVFLWGLTFFDLGLNDFLVIKAIAAQSDSFFTVFFLGLNLIPLVFVESFAKFGGA